MSPSQTANYEDQTMTRREKVLSAIRAAIDGKKYQLLNLNGKYGGAVLEDRRQKIQDEQAMYRELLSEIKAGKRI